MIKQLLVLQQQQSQEIISNNKTSLSTPLEFQLSDDKQKKLMDDLKNAITYSELCFFRCDINFIENVLIDILTPYLYEAKNNNVLSDFLIDCNEIYAPLTNVNELRFMIDLHLNFTDINSIFTAFAVGIETSSFYKIMKVKLLDRAEVGRGISISQR